MSDAQGTLMPLIMKMAGIGTKIGREKDEGQFYGTINSQLKINFKTAESLQ